MLGRRGLLAGVGVVAAGARAAQAGGVTPELLAAARKEGSVTWYIAQVDTETAEAMGRAFTAQYPGVTVSVIRTTGQVAYERLLQDLKNQAPQCDVFSSTDISQYPALKKRGALADYTPAGAATLLPAFAKVSDPGFMYPSSATAHLLIYNSAQVKEGPKAWTDLLRAEMEGAGCHRPSGLQRLHRHLGAGADQDLWLGLLREAGEEQSAHRAVGQ